MKKSTACKILGVYPDISESELKKKYRSLMSLTHPDSQNAHDYPYDAYEINEAYEYLINNLMSEDEKKAAKVGKKGKARSKSTGNRWNAPVNPNAYIEREIYQYYEDIDGSKLGIVTIDEGKYTWITDEDFSLFLKSLYNVAKKIIAADDDKKGLSRTNDTRLMADIAYLLSGQFFGADTALGLMKKDGDAYFTKASLESGVVMGTLGLGERMASRGAKSNRLAPGAESQAPSLKSGDILIPLGVKDHRLYVGDKIGNKLGYLSLKDDRLLFGLIPLFEQKVVTLKMEVGKLEKSKSPEINLWIKKLPVGDSATVDSINLRIERYLG